jgi:hypothetical protein
MARRSHAQHARDIATLSKTGDLRDPQLARLERRAPTNIKKYKIPVNVFEH